MILVVLISLVMLVWTSIFMRWQRGIYLLLIYVPFAGMVTLILYPSRLPLLFKDIFFIIPAYLAFFFFNRIFSRKKDHSVRIPSLIVIIIVILAVWVVIEMLNPNVKNLLVGLIGLKVWLLYLPLIFLGSAIINKRDDLAKILRTLTVLAWIPCSLGIIQWLVSLAFGYRDTMQAFYGDLAYQVTQGFTQFDIGGRYIFRIPSTFTFVTQYCGYALSMIVVSYALMRLDPSSKWRKFAAITLMLVVLAGFMSGVRAAFVFIPIIIVLVSLFDGRGIIIKTKRIILPVVIAFIFFNITGIGRVAMYKHMQELIINYVEVHIRSGFVDVINNAPLFGLGTGMNTGPARYAFNYPDSFRPFESYYGKAVIELGILGLFIVLTLFLSLIWSGYIAHKRIHDKKLRGYSAAILAFIITIAIINFKGWQIDLDPINVYFWIFTGILFKLPSMEAEERPVKTAINKVLKISKPIKKLY